MKKIYKVHVNTVIIIEAEENDDREIQYQARSSVSDNILNTPEDISYEELTSLNQLLYFT